jgi:hypothetical protein
MGTIFGANPLFAGFSPPGSPWIRWADIVRGTWLTCCSFFAASFVDQHTLATARLEAMTSLNEMSETEALDCMRAELQILISILGELVPDFWKTLIDQWKKEGRHGISPVDRRYPLDELSKMATEWLLARNTLH